MPNQVKPGIRWNIFAWVLEDILLAHGSPLSMLDNLMLDGRELIHRAQVGRLQQSLKSPKSFPLLNPDDMERIKAYFNLNEDEITRLHVAIIATSIERILMNRIAPEDAYLASEQLYHLILEAARKEALAQFSMALLRAGQGEIEMERQQETAAGLQEEEIEPSLAPALDALDRAMSALHLGLDTDSFSERLYRLRQAHEGFRHALEKLHQAPEVIQALDAWRYWHDEAQDGLERAREGLAQSEL